MIIRNSVIYIALFLFSLMTMQGFSQVMTPEQARTELENQGIDYDELDRRLQAKGININQMDPDDIVDNQAIIEKTVNEMLAELEQEEKTTEEVDRSAANPLLRRIDTVLAKEQIMEVDSLESFVSLDSLEENLVDPDTRIYGQHLFINQSIQVYTERDRILPNNAYQLGSGDEVAISIFGSSQFEGQFNIDNSGYIYPARMPRIFLKGLSLSLAREKMEKVFRNYYRFAKGEFSVQVSSTRNVTVGVFGNAEKIGSYSLPAMNTAINVIAAAGGPTELGSVRKIRLHRGEEIKFIDLYAFMSNPSAAHDYYLEDNDIIQIPEAEKVVSIEGEVKKPFIFELLHKENLVDLIQYAGGLTDDAYTDNIQIRRKTQTGFRLYDVNLSDIISRNGDFVLNPGDEISIRKIRSRTNQVVYIDGEVNYPGEFNLTSGMTIYDLIKKGGLNNLSREDFALLYRLNADSTYSSERIDLSNIINNVNAKNNIELKEGDRLQMFSKSAFSDNYTFSIEGNVRNPGSFPLDSRQSLRVSDAILLSNGFNPNVHETGMVLRTPVNKPMNKQWISFNVINAMADPNSTDNIFLEPLDKVIIYSNENFGETYQLTSFGAVRRPATTPYGEGVRVSDLIIMSDGLRPDASDKGYIVRSNLKNKNEEFYIPVNIEKAITSPGTSEDILLDPGDRLFVFTTTELTDRFPVDISGEVRNPGEYIYSPTMSLKSLLLLAGGLKFSAATNRVEIFRLIFNENNPVQKALISVQLDDDLNIIDHEDITLQPFDIVVVRKIPGFEFHETVFLEGEFIYPGTYSLLSDNERVTDLIERSGGFTQEAFLPAAKLYRNEDDKGYVVIRLDEIMRNRNSAMNIRLKAGDKLIVPKSEELVVIRGDVDLQSAVLDDIAEQGKINVAFIGKRRAMHYINQFTGGLNSSTTKQYIKVKYPNGAINRTKRFLFFSTTPKVEAGAEIIVDSKPPEVIKKQEDEDKEKVDWGKVVSNSIAQAGAILSLILLIQQVD